MAPFRSFHLPCFSAFLSAIGRYLCCENSSIRPFNEKHGCFSPVSDRDPGGNPGNCKISLFCWDSLLGLYTKFRNKNLPKN